MKINIIKETKVSEVVLQIPSKPAPQRIWVIVGEIPLLDDEDDLDTFELTPIYELNSNTGKKEKSEHYFMGSFSSEHLEKVLQSHEVINLINFPEGGGEPMEFIKKLYDLFRQLGHEVILIEAIDF